VARSCGWHAPLNVTNNSLLRRPFYWNCPSDPAEKAILTAETRAIRFSQRHGVLNVARGELL